MNGKYLITTDAWFIAPDGQQYKSVWGEVQILEDSSVFGIKTNARSANWYAKVGTKENHVIVAGCQIHYAVRCEEAPNTKEVHESTTEEGKETTVTRRGYIYIADDYERAKKIEVVFNCENLAKGVELVANSLKNISK